jgi:hypothetical protein
MRTARSSLRTGFAAALLAALASLGAAGCSNPADDTHPGDTGRDDAREGSADVPVDVGDEDRVIPDYAYDNVCAEEDFDMHHEIVRLMLLLDQSSSMQGSPWSEATSALEDLLTNPAFEDMYFGLDAFPDGYPGAWSDCSSRPLPCMSCREDECGTAFPPQVAVNINYVSSPDIIAHMNDPAFPQFCTFTPLVNQLEYYDTGAGPTEAPEIYAADGDNYLVVISDGEDEGCFDGDPVGSLGTHVRSIRETHGINSFAIGFGSSSGEMAAELNAIASNGGTAFTTFLHVEDGAALAAALEEIASSVITCDYVLDDPGPSADPGDVNFYLDGTVVPMDDGCSETTGSGWHWVDAAHTTVEFCGDFCTRIRGGTIGTITATFGCPTILL